MIENVSYRGPDGMGTQCFGEEGVALAHRRLSILDLSEAGRQPMGDSTGRYWITFNGEIYNYLEVRELLIGFGWQFESSSDTEVLLKAYIQWGSACLSRLLGMFAFAIWDREDRVLFAARDRLGIKPLYYLEYGGALLFASEIKSILAAVKPGRLSVDRSLIDAYMAFGYVPGEDTLHAGVKRLLPGHMLLWRNGRVAISEYWDVSFEETATDAEAVLEEQLRSLLGEVISIHMRSDVPLGVFLSGGLDSSSVVAMLSPGARAGLKTFSVAYAFGSEYDETPYARMVASRFGTDHHEIRVEPREFQDFIPRFVWHMDEPVTEAAAISLYFVSRLARQEVVVCLSGEGADELFAGYDFYRYNLMLERMRSVPLLGAACGAFARWSPGGAKLDLIRKYLALAGQPLEQRYRGISSYDTTKTQGLYSREFWSVASAGNAQCRQFVDSLFARTAGKDPLSRMLYFDMKTWLVDDLLIKADRMSMATSIELRVPFLDHRLVEFAAKVPSDLKLRGKQVKHLLKKAMAPQLPSAIIERKKVGFPTPLEIMLRGELFGYASELLLSKEATDRGYFDPSAVRALLDTHKSGQRSNHREIWQLIVLEEWHRQFGY